MKVNCPNCQQKYEIDDSQLDVKIQCKKCNHYMFFASSHYKDSESLNLEPKKIVKLKPANERSTGVKLQSSSTVNYQKSSHRPIRVTSSSNNGAGLVVCLVVAIALLGVGLFAYNQSSIEQPIENERVVEEVSDVLTNTEANTTSDQAVAGNLNESSSSDEHINIDPDIDDPNETLSDSEPVPDSERLVVIQPDKDDSISTDTIPVKKFSKSELNSSFTHKVKPYFQEHCSYCHGPKKEKGDLRTDLILSDINDDYTLSHLQNIVDEITVENMPPEDEPRPNPEDTVEVIEVLRALIESSKEENDTGGGRPVRRLTRTEYINTIWDFFGVEIDAEGLASDLVIGHFESDVDTLITTDLHIESYLRKSREVVRVFIENRKNESVPQSYNFFATFIEENPEEPNDLSANRLIKKFAVLAKRGRSVDDEYAQKLYGVFKKGRKSGMSFWQALEEPFAISICSMDSLLHFENRNPKSKSNDISGLELANRLSYILWRSAPDFELVRLGRSGSLLEPGVKEQQVKRMMKDERFHRFLNDFTEQWLELPRQDEIAVDDRVYREFDESVKPSMKEETVQFIAHLIRNDLPISKLIDSEFMILNDAMASYYGISGVSGSEFRPVLRDNSEEARVRGGILTHAGILMQGGTGDRTSIVERGAFVARKLLDKPPADPPPNVEPLPTKGEDFTKMTGVQLVRAHANAPECANCHAKIDPLGVGLENFDAVGQFRSMEQRLHPDIESFSKRQLQNPGNLVITLPIETSGKLYDGQPFDGILELKRVLMSKRHDLARGFIKALLSYSNGREANLTDEALVDEIVRKTAGDNYPTRKILEEIIFSKAMVTF